MKDNSHALCAHTPGRIHVPTIGRTEFLPIGNFPAHAPGMILYMSRDGGDDVQFDLRLFNRAEPEATWGTKVPVVRESEFATAIAMSSTYRPAQRSAVRCAFTVWTTFRTARPCMYGSTRMRKSCWPLPNCRSAAYRGMPKSQ
jgi:hypothetical protein